jgi:hypothetical protein
MTFANKSKVVIILSIVYFFNQFCGALEPDWMPREAEYSRFMLFDKGQKMRLFFPGNMQLFNTEIIKLDAEHKAGVPVLRISDNDSSNGLFLGQLPCPHGFQVQPYTEYEFRFQHKTQTFAGTPPYFELEQCDINMDFLTKKNHHFRLQQTPQWFQQTIKIKTGPDTHYLVPRIFSAKEGTAELLLGDVIVEQLTDTGALRPISKTLIDKSNIELCSKIQIIAKTDLPATKHNYQANVRFKTDQFRGRAVLAVQWLNENEQKIATDYCIVCSDIRVKPKWNSVFLEWKRDYNQDSIDGVSLEMVRVLDKDQDDRTDVVINRLMFDAPRQSQAIILKVVERSFSGKVELEQFLLKTY